MAPRRVHCTPAENYGPCCDLILYTFSFSKLLQVRIVVCPQRWSIFDAGKYGIFGENTDATLLLNHENKFTEHCGALWGW